MISSEGLWCNSFPSAQSIPDPVASLNVAVNTVWTAATPVPKCVKHEAMAKSCALC